MTLADLTPEEFAQWSDDYYLGLMVCPFGEKLDEYGRSVYAFTPYGMSIHGMPRLHPDDE